MPWFGGLTLFKDIQMIRMFVRHPVADFATWKQAYDAFADERTGDSIRTFTSTGKSMMRCLRVSRTYS